MEVEVNTNFKKANDTWGNDKGLVAVTPPLDGSYWAYRVMLTKKQAIIAFPKFFTMGIGFQVEAEDWNTNLPYTSQAEEIYNHIAVNKGDEAITKEICIEAIKLLQDLLSVKP